jgi:hypothetical protein
LPGSFRGVIFLVAFLGSSSTPFINLGLAVTGW